MDDVGIGSNDIVKQRDLNRRRLLTRHRIATL